MDLRAFVFACAAAVAATSLWSVSARAACVNDIDCTAGGTACGSQVCDWNNGMTCAPVGPGVVGWCTVDTDCKCHSLGATCNKSMFNCTFIASDAGAGAGGSGSGSGGGASSSSGGSTTSSSSGGGNTTSSSSSSGSTTSSSSSGGGSSKSSGGCAVIGSGATAPWGFAAMAAAVGLAMGRRRRRPC